MFDARFGGINMRMVLALSKPWVFLREEVLTWRLESLFDTQVCKLDVEIIWNWLVVILVASVVASCEAVGGGLSNAGTRKHVP